MSLEFASLGMKTATVLQTPLGPGADEDLAFLTICLTSLSLGGLILNSAVGGTGRGIYPCATNGTFLAGSLYCSLTCCSSCCLVISSFPLFFSSCSCLACLKGSLKKLAHSFCFRLLRLQIRSALRSLDSLCFTSPHRVFRSSFSASVAFLHLLRSCRCLCTSW